MPGPAPKPKGQRRHRNATPGYRQLDPSEREGPPPEWPLAPNALPEFHALEEARWIELWRLPQSREWIRMRCFTAVALYARLEVLVTTGMPDPRMISEVRQLDMAIGVSPKAMMNLRWEIPDQEEAADEVEQKRSEKPRVYTPVQAVG